MVNFADRFPGESHRHQNLLSQSLAHKPRSEAVEIRKHGSETGLAGLPVNRREEDSAIRQLSSSDWRKQSEQQST